MFWAVIGSGYLKSSPSYDLLANCYGFYSNNAVVNAKFNKDRYSNFRNNFGTYASTQHYSFREVIPHIKFCKKNVRNNLRYFSHFLHFAEIIKLA